MTIADMAQFRSIIFGPWRAVLVLGVTQILAWGTLWYPPVLTMPLIAADRGWSLSFTMGGVSAGLFVGGFCAPTLGRLIDHYGGHRVMTAGSLASAAGLVALATVENRIGFFAVCMFIGIGIAASLYDAAFATLGRIFGADARRPITLLTFAGGFASTIGWPATLFLIDHTGWRGAYFTFAALLAFVAAPLHAFVLPRSHALRPAVVARQDEAPVIPVPPPPPGVAAFIFLAIAFAAYAFITSGLSAHMLAIFRRSGLDAATAVALGALFGPTQVAARLCEFAFAGTLHPLRIARFAVIVTLAALALLLLAGISLPTAAAFAIMFGMSNGLITIARGTVPLALFGPVGYGRLVGRIARPAMFMQAVAPVTLAIAVEHVSDKSALTLLALFAATSLASFILAERFATARA